MDFVWAEFLQPDVHLESETGLYKVKLVHTMKSGVDGVWSWGKGNPYVDQKEGKITYPS